MSVGMPAIQAGLARLQDPELTLAAFSVALSAGMFLHSPVVMLFVSATALVCDERSYRMTRNTMLVFCATVVGLSALITLWPPMYDLVFTRILRFPAAIASAARPGLVAIIPWAAPIGIRRYYQGILIKFGETRVVSLGSAIRLLTMILVVTVGVVAAPAHGVLVGGVALMAGVTADMLVALLLARRLLLRHVLAAESTEATPAGLYPLRFAAFYAPLMVTTALRQVARPLMLSGIARSHDPVLALAAFPVATATLQLLSEFTQMVQQVTVAKTRDDQSASVVQRFALLLAAACTGLVALVAFTPIGEIYHGGVIGLEGTALAMTNVTLRLLVPAAALVTMQNYFSGLLIRQGNTMVLNLAAVCNVVVLVTGISWLAANTVWPGHLIGGGMLTLSVLVEAGLLFYWARPSIRRAWRFRSG